MALSFRDQLASSCPQFVRALRIRHSRSITDERADYYLIDTSYSVVKVACSFTRSSNDFKYIADATFVKKYSSLFVLGRVLQWKTYDDLKAWMSMIVSQRPRFIDPYYRSIVMSGIPQRLPQGFGIIAYHPSWFISNVADIHQNMTITVPRCFQPFLFAPHQAVAIVHSGNRSWYVKLQRGALTEGWDEVVNAHNLKLGYCLLFAVVGHLQFDLFVFNRYGHEINYEWSTTLPIQQLNAPVGWDAEIAISIANRSVAMTSCPPVSFRACRHAQRCALLLRYTDLRHLEMPAQFNSSFQVEGRTKFTLVSKQREWTVQYINGYITGNGWLNFVSAHNLTAGNTLIVSPDINMKLFTMIIGCADHERLYQW